jgi:hypothetical protein
MHSPLLLLGIPWSQNSFTSFFKRKMHHSYSPVTFKSIPLVQKVPCSDKSEKVFYNIYKKKTQKKTCFFGHLPHIAASEQFLQMKNAYPFAHNSTLQHSMSSKAQIWSEQ